MASPVSVLVERGGVVESRHRVHAAVVRDGTVVEAAGEPGLVTFFRSAAKPLQALTLVHAVPDLTDAEVAIACASHGAQPEQLGAVRSVLARAGAREEDLECGEHEGSRLHHNCSGKHAGMLLLAHARGWARRGYRLPGHRVQRETAAAVENATGVERGEIVTAVDGCGVPTYAVSLAAMASAFARLVRRELPGADRVVAAMRARPELLQGPAGLVDVTVIRRLEGAIAKAGAEGVLCVALGDGTGVALKVEDGGWRAVGPAVGSLLGIDELRESPLWNSRGEMVGRVRAA